MLIETLSIEEEEEREKKVKEKWKKRAQCERLAHTTTKVTMSMSNHQFEKCNKIMQCAHTFSFVEITAFSEPLLMMLLYIVG